MNKVLLVGNLASDPAVRTGAKGSVTRLTVATNHVGRDAEGERRESADFHDCVAFGKTGEVIAEHFTKGKPISVEGRLHTSSWETPEGRKWRTEVIVESFEFIGAKAPSSAAA